MFGWVYADRTDMTKSAFHYIAVGIKLSSFSVLCIVYFVTQTSFPHSTPFNEPWLAPHYMASHFSHTEPSSFFPSFYCLSILLSHCLFLCPSQSCVHFAVDILYSSIPVPSESTFPFCFFLLSPYHFNF